MAQLPYVVITRNLDIDAATIPPGQRINIVPTGRAIREIAIRKVSPVSQDVNLHFGEDKDAFPTYQGEVFGEDSHLLLSDYFNDGVWYSLPAGSAPAAGSLLVVSIIYAG